MADILETLRARNTALKEELARLQHLERLTAAVAADEQKDQPQQQSVERLYAEVNRAKDAFDRIDADRSGTIEAQELQRLAAALGHAVHDGPELQELLGALDKNGNGRIEFYEFLVWWSGKSGAGEPAGSIKRLLRLKSQLQRDRFQEPIGRLVRQLSNLQPAGAAPQVNRWNASLAVGRVGPAPRTQAVLEFLPQGAPDQVVPSAAEGLALEFQCRLRDFATAGDVARFWDSVVPKIDLPQLQPAEFSVSPVDGSKRMTVRLLVPVPEVAQELGGLRLGEHLRKFELGVHTNLSWAEILQPPKNTDEGGEAVQAQAQGGGLLQDCQAELRFEAEIERALFRLMLAQAPENLGPLVPMVLRLLELKLQLGSVQDLVAAAGAAHPMAGEIAAIAEGPLARQVIAGKMQEFPSAELGLDMAGLAAYRNLVEEFTSVRLVLPSGEAFQFRLKGVVPSAVLCNPELDNTEV